MTGEVRGVVVGGRQLRVAVRPGRAAAGARPPLLLISGIGVSLEMFGPLVREFDPDVEVSRLHVYHGGHLGVATEAAELAPLVDAFTAAP